MIVGLDEKGRSHAESRIPILGTLDAEDFMELGEGEVSRRAAN